MLRRLWKWIGRMARKGGGVWDFVVVAAAVIAGTAFLSKLLRPPTYYCPVCECPVPARARICPSCRTRLLWPER